MAFFVAEFVLVMQFLWKYIDDIIGKGFSLGVLLEMIFYFSVRIIPEAVPVTILIASVMVFGNLAEKYEISSMKSSGISLLRIMWMGILISIITALFSLLASNYLKPRANYKFIYRFNAIRKQKPALNIEESTFSKDFKNFVIRVGDKDPNGRDIKDILIYDHSVPDKRKLNMLVAEEGEMYAGENDNYFVMELENGEQYREVKKANAKVGDDNEPFIRTQFKKWTKVFDMSEFDLEATNLNLHRKEYDLLNASQLLSAIDSIDKKKLENKIKTAYNFNDMLAIETSDKRVIDKEEKNLPKHVQEAMQKKTQQEENKAKSKKSNSQFVQEYESLEDHATLLTTFNLKDQKYLAKAGKYTSEKRQDRLSRSASQENSIQRSRAWYVLRLHQQYAWALICVVFLFIGAPLGSIVKKGGYGWPLLVAIIFFMMFIILNILGERLIRSMAIGPVLAAWISILILSPIAIFLTYRAVNDIGISDIKNFFSRLIRVFARAKS